MSNGKESDILLIYCERCGLTATIKLITLSEYQLGLAESYKSEANWHKKPTLFLSDCLEVTLFPACNFPSLRLDNYETVVMWTGGPKLIS